MPSLFVFRGNDQGLRIELTEDMLGLGRDVANQIQLHDTEVSRRHAVLLCRARHSGGIAAGRTLLAVDRGNVSRKLVFGKTGLKNV